MKIIASLDRVVTIDAACERYAEATADYIVRLETIVGSLQSLTTGDHGFDYTVSVPQSEILRIDGLLADLTFETESKYGAIIRTRAIPAPETG